MQRFIDQFEPVLLSSLLNCKSQFQTSQIVDSQNSLVASSFTAHCNSNHHVHAIYNSSVIFKQYLIAKIVFVVGTSGKEVLDSSSFVIIFDNFYNLTLFKSLESCSSELTHFGTQLKIALSKHFPNNTEGEIINLLRSNFFYFGLDIITGYNSLINTLRTLPHFLINHQERHSNAFKLAGTSKYLVVIDSLSIFNIMEETHHSMGEESLDSFLSLASQEHSPVNLTIISDNSKFEAMMRSIRYLQESLLFNSSFLTTSFRKQAEDIRSIEFGRLNNAIHRNFYTYNSDNKSRDKIRNELGMDDKIKLVISDRIFSGLGDFSSVVLLQS